MIKEIQWHDDHDKLLSVSAGNDLEIVKKQVKSGVAQLWECVSDKNYGLVVTRIDTGNEWCIVLGEGSGFFEFVPFFLSVAEKKGLTIRTHVKRKGLIKMWSKVGLSLSEYVLRN